jgi:phage shock protein A
VNPLTALVSRLEALLDSILSAAEDPQDRVRALVADLRRRQSLGRRALGLSIALEKRLLAQLHEAEDELAAWEKAARETLSEDAARRVLELGPAVRERRQRFEEQRAAAQRVRAAVAEAARRTGEVAHARSVLLARARSAEALASITQTLELLRSPEVARTLGEAELAAEEKEAAAPAQRSR